MASRRTILLRKQGEHDCAQMRSIVRKRLPIALHSRCGATSKIKRPVRLVTGAKNALVPVSDIRALADAAPRATCHRVQSHFGHDALLNEDVALAITIADFRYSLELA